MQLLIHFKKKKRNAMINIINLYLIFIYNKIIIIIIIKIL